MIQTWGQSPIWSRNYGRFSTGMRDDRVPGNLNLLAGRAIRLLSAMQQCILPAAVNNHATWNKGIKPWLQQAKPNVANR